MTSPHFLHGFLFINHDNHALRVVVVELQRCLAYTRLALFQSMS